MPATPFTLDWPSSLPSVPTSRATRVASEANELSRSTIVLTTSRTCRKSPQTNRLLQRLRPRDHFRCGPKQVAYQAVYARGPRAGRIRRMRAMSGSAELSHHFCKLPEFLSNAFAEEENALVSVRKHFESFESFVIQSGDLIRERHHRCGRRRTADVTTAANCDIRVI